MQTQPRPELREPVLAFAARLHHGDREIPLTEMAALFGAPADLLDQVRARGDLVFKDEVFSNDGPELSVPAGKVELEIPSLIRGNWTSDAAGFALTFPLAEFAPRACAKIAFFRKCFELRELRTTQSDITLDFGNDMANRCYTF